MAIVPIPNIQSSQLLQAQLNANFADIASRLGSAETSVSTLTTEVAANTANLAVLNGFSGTVSTTDATVTTVATISTTSGAAINLTVQGQARRTGGVSGTAGDSAAYQLAVGAKNIAGTVTIISQSLLFTAESQAGWDFSATASGANILLRVTGAAANNVNWSVSGRKYEVT